MYKVPNLVRVESPHNKTDGGMIHVDHRRRNLPRHPESSPSTLSPFRPLDSGGVLFTDVSGAWVKFTWGPCTGRWR